MSAAAFCDAAEEFETRFDAADDGTAAGVQEIRAAARTLREAGVPDDIPDDAREGLVLTLEALTGLADEADQADVDAAFAFTEEEKAKSVAFEAYLDDTCAYRSE